MRNWESQEKIQKKEHKLLISMASGLQNSTLCPTFVLQGKNNSKIKIIIYILGNSETQYLNKDKISEQIKVIWRKNKQIEKER